MIVIYIKLGTAAEFDDERLNFHLNAQVTAAALDNSNLNDNIINGLNSGRIVQITRTEFYGIVAPDPETPIVVNPTDLATLNQFLEPCPIDATVLFGYVGGKWYKILWSTLKQCLGSGGSGGSGLAILFRVGDNVNPVNYPEDGDTFFIDEQLEGRESSQLLVMLNGVELHHKSLFDPADLPEAAYYELDPDNDTPGKFKPSIAFTDRDRWAIRVLANAKKQINLRVGNIANESWAPEATDEFFEHPIFENKGREDLLVLLNSTELYHKSMYHPDDQEENNWYDIDPDNDNPDKFVVNVPFADKDLLNVIELL